MPGASVSRARHALARGAEVRGRDGAIGRPSRPPTAARWTASPSMTEASSITRSCTRAPWPSAAVVRVWTFISKMSWTSCRVSRRPTGRRRCSSEPPAGPRRKTVAHVQVHDRPSTSWRGPRARSIRAGISIAIGGRPPRAASAGLPAPPRARLLNSPPRRVLAGGQVISRGERVVDDVDDEPRGPRRCAACPLAVLAGAAGTTTKKRGSADRRCRHEVV